MKAIASAVVLSASLAFSAPTLADVVISGTRVIYNQSASEVMVKMNNAGERPLLAQVWVDDGRSDVNPQEMNAPFIVTPPVSRLNAKTGQTVRIAWNGKPLPQDRESLFWFNVLEAPPKAKAAPGESQLQVALRTRIKLFFRPEGLKGNAGDAIKLLKWQLVREGDKTWASVNNSTPWNVAVIRGSVKVNGKEYAFTPASIAPFGQAKFVVNNLSSTHGEINWVALNDFGSEVSASQK